MQLSKDIPEKIDVLEYLLPILKRMTVEPSYKGDTRIPELRFIEFLEELSVNSSEAQRLIQFVETEILKVAKERNLMAKRADGYLELYATDYNHYFRETKNYKSQAGRILIMARTIFEEFTNTSKREKYIYYEYNENESENDKWKRKMHSLFNSSPLNRPQVQNSIFGLETFQPIHQLLFSKLQNLFLNLLELFEYAQNIDNMVEGLRKNHARILAIFKKCKKKMKDRDLKYLMLVLNYTKMETIFPVLTKDLREMSFEDFIVKYYHELNNAEFAFVIPLYEKFLKESYGIEKDEASLYEDVLDVKEKIKRVKKLRFFMDHLDEFDTKGIKISKSEDHYVSGYFIAMLMKELEIPYGKGSEFVETYFTNHYHGKYVPVKFGAVDKKKIDEKSDRYIKFKNTANRLIADLERNTSQITEQKCVQKTDIRVQSSLLDRIFV